MLLCMSVCVYICVCVCVHTCMHVCEQINKMFIVAKDSFAKDEIAAEVGKWQTGE